MTTYLKARLWSLQNTCRDGATAQSNSQIKICRVGTKFRGQPSSKLPHAVHALPCVLDHERDMVFLRSRHSRDCHIAITYWNRSKDVASFGNVIKGLVERFNQLKDILTAFSESNGGVDTFIWLEFGSSIHHEPCAQSLPSILTGFGLHSIH